ncbi:MAG: transporter substrate-binding domain-containing protein [Lachnospiraceae bacterium]
MRETGKKIFALLLAVCLCFLSPCSLVTATERNEQNIKVALLNFPNYLEEDANGNISGYAYDYLMDIAEYTGYTYDFERMNVAQAEKAVQEGKVDIIVGERREKEKEAYCDFSELPMGQDTTVICVRPEDNTYAFNDYKAFQNKKIAVLKGSGRQKSMEKIFQKNDVKVQFVEVRTDKEQKQALEKKTVDAILMSSIRCGEKYKVVVRADYESLYFMLNRKKQGLKEQFDKAQKQIHIENPYYEYDLNQQHYGHMGKKVAFTAEEKEYINKVEKLTVAVDPDWAPMSYYEKKSGKYKGIIIDFFDRISQDTGIQFQYVADEGPKKNKRDMRTGKIDLLSCVIYQDQSSHAYEIKKTNPYYSDSLTAVTNSQISDYRDTACKVAAKKGSPLYLWKENRSPYKNLTLYTSYEDCVEKVNAGEQDVAFVPNYSSSYLTGHLFYQKLKEYTVPDSDYDYCVGVPDNQDKRLVSILNKSIANLSQETRNDIVQRNIQNMSNPYSKKDFVYENAQYILLGIVLLLLVVIVFAMRISSVRKKANQRLTDAIHQAETANAAKSDFLSRMSHDIRTPMNAIIGMTSIAIDEVENPESMKDCLTKINSSSQFLLGLVNDILDMSKIESQALELHPVPYEYKEFIETLRTMFQVMCEKKEIHFLVQEAEVPVPFLVDKVRFNQIFFNILSNAVKFTPKGGTVEFSTYDVKRNGDRISCSFSVTDTGIGMSPEFLKHLYEPFSQESVAETAEIQGTGLGLPIAKNLVELMGGTIDVSSATGKGTRVKIQMEMPVAHQPVAKKEPIKEEAEELLKGKQVLLTEDQPLNTEIAKRLLEKKGIIVTCAVNGKEAVETFAASKENQFALILMDIRMPVMNGLDAAKEIRALERKDAKNVPIIALSANAFDEDTVKSREVGMNAHLSKPIQPKLLFETLEEWIQKDA